MSDISPDGIDRLPKSSERSRWLLDSAYIIQISKVCEKVGNKFILLGPTNFHKFNMATVLIRSVLFIVLTTYVLGDEIELEVQSGNLLKMLREMVNQTAAESLNLPANATSIRENITDTFSCENRTYGYYADVDNECQIFHVCLPSQMPSGRNVTYRWSFICPQETIFNQEVLVCTRERDSIPCEDSPNYYDLNMEIGKIVEPDINKEEIETNKKETENIPVKKENRQTNRKKQNIIMEALMKDAVDQIEVIEEVLNAEKTEELPVIEFDKDLKSEKEGDSDVPKVEDVIIEEIKPQVEPISEQDENTRLGSERRLKRTGRKISRGSIRFRGDI
ncbi:unnamed protein product, partial [Brenthis ino]